MTFKITLVMIGFIISVAGWFLLGVVLLGGLGVEEFLQSTALLRGCSVAGYTV